MDCKLNEYRIHITEPDGSERDIVCDGFVVIADHDHTVELHIRNMRMTDIVFAICRMGPDLLDELLKKNR